MISIVGIQLQNNGKIYYFDSNQLLVKPGDYVIADTVRGIDIGEVVIGIREVDESNAVNPVKKLIRIATEQDIRQSSENRIKEKEAYEICQRKIAEHQLDMKLVSVEYAFDNSKILFYFTANGRVDFRSLVKDLASVFKMRIELRQIGVRDEAKMLGGLGPCGRQICCGTFLSEFQPVSIKMAKEQNLSLNPTKISGVCGRLMCCLKYEQDHYEQTRKRMPKVGREVNTPDGTGIVSDLNVVKETVSVRITNGDTSEIKEYPLEEVTRNPETGNETGPVSAKQPGRKNGKANDSESNISVAAETENECISENEASLSGKRKKPAKEKNYTDSENRKPKEKKEKNQLGKPVKRENPNRIQAAQKDQKKPADESPKKENDKTPANWADALQKAMDAIS